MTETLSIRLDPATKQRLSALALHSKRSASFLAAEAITAYVEQEEWQLGEMQAAIAKLDAGISPSCHSSCSTYAVIASQRTQKHSNASASERSTSFRGRILEQ